MIGVLDLGPPEVSKISGVKFAIGVFDFRPGRPICDRGVRFAPFRNPFEIPRAQFVIGVLVLKV